jgi:hypothetical protein
MKVFIVMQIDQDGNPRLTGVYNSRSWADSVFDSIVEEDQLHEEEGWSGDTGDLRCAGDDAWSVHMMEAEIE